MAGINQQTLLDSLEEQVERHLQEAVRVFQNLPESTLLRPAPDGGWSIAQCLDHLNSYGHYYLPQLEKGLAQSTSAGGTFKSTWLGSYFTQMMNPQTGTRKYKAFKDYTPERALDAPAVVAEFIRQQEVLLRYFARARTADLNAVWIPVSIFRWVKLKLGDVLQFLIAHNERHLQQALRHLRPVAQVP